MSTVADWLIHLADPLGPATAQPKRPLDATSARELFAQADQHGVLGPVLRNFERDDHPSSLDAVHADAVRRHHETVGFSLMLEHFGQALIRAINAEKLRGIIVKGPAFARELYPERVMRRFTDIDILADPESIPRIGQILGEQRFRLAEQSGGAEPQEWKWVHRDHDDVTIEVQSNLIHADRLRAALSLKYSDIVREGDAAQAGTPASLMVVAAVHGGGHHFERLLHVVDICQAARHLQTLADEQQLDLLIERTNSRLATVVGLNLAGRFFADRRCRDLAKALGPVRFGAIASGLINRSAVTTAMGSSRALNSWRRSAFRELLKRGTFENRRKDSAPRDRRKTRG